MSNWLERYEAPDDRRLLEQESLIVEVTDILAGSLDDAGLSRAELAEKLGSSRAHITQLLSGSRNMTLRTLADLGWALGCRVRIHLEPLRQGEFGAVRDQPEGSRQVPVPKHATGGRAKAKKSSGKRRSKTRTGSRR